jgi:hypothetical protein
MFSFLEYNRDPVQIWGIRLLLSLMHDLGTKFPRHRNLEEAIINMEARAIVLIL